MFIWHNFFFGLSTVLNFGLPFKSHFSSDPERQLEGDWNRVAGDLSKALAKYRAEGKNDKG